MEIYNEQALSFLLLLRFRGCQRNDDIFELDVGWHQYHTDDDCLWYLIFLYEIFQLLFRMDLQAFLKCKALWDALDKIKKATFLRKETAEVQWETLFAYLLQEKVIEVFEKRILCKFNVSLNVFEWNFSYKSVVAKHVISSW